MDIWDDFFGTGGGRRRPSLKDWKEPLHKMQKGKCMYCGVKIREGDGEVDHKNRAFSRGGKETPKNMQLLCAPCNRRKGDLTDAQFRKRFAAILPATLPPARPIQLAKFEAIAKGVAERKAKAAKKRRESDPFGFF